jgi:SAM-dependent methyltransferase
MPIFLLLGRVPLYASPMIRKLLIALLVPALAFVARADDLLKPAKPPVSPTTKPAPAPLTHYKGREIAQTMHWTGARWLTREEREKEEDTKTLIKVLNVQPGQIVCDLGCGNGFYSLQLARLVAPNGIVLAEDIQPEMLELLKKRADKEKIPNIHPILGDLADPNLPDGKCDLILLVDVYHELSNPEEMLAAIRKALSPTGRLALVEFRGEDPNVPIKPLHRMSKAQIMKELPPNGFRLSGQFDGLPWQHVMFFQRDDAPQANRP